MPTFAHVSGNIYAVAYEGPGNNGWINTFSVSDDGKTINSIRQYEFDNDHGQYISMMKISPNIFLLSYKGKSQTGWLKTIRISNSGTSIAEVDRLNHDLGRVYDGSLVRVDWNTYLLAYTQNSRGYLKTFDVPLDGDGIEYVAQYLSLIHI